MLTFPTYRGELPQCLNPLNLRHYFLLAYWVYFRPTALKCYLYQADPDLYCAGPGLSIVRILRVPAYRNLYPMVPGAIMLFSVLVGLPAVLMTSWLHDTPVDWLGWALGVAWGLALGLAWGSTVGVSASVALGLAWGLVIGVSASIAIGISAGVAVGMAFGMKSVVAGVSAGVTIGIGALRVLFYPFRKGRGHPLEWDELFALPLPGTRHALLRRLQQDKEDGLHFVAEVARNPFQRWVAQRALQTYLHEEGAKPLHFLYALLGKPDLNAYVFAPVTKQDWEQLPSIRQLLLGELDGQWVDCSSEWMNRLAERLVWGLTWFFRDRRETALTRFVGMLYELLDAGTIAANEFDLSAYARIYTGLTSYPGGEEIARSFEAMAEFLAYDNLPDLLQAIDVVEDIRESLLLEPIRPTVLTALDRLGQVGSEIDSYQDATSRINRLAALARATDALDDLDEYVVTEVMAPEQYILRRVIRQWRKLVSETGGEIGRAEEVGYVVNPYVAGNPVTGDLFVGREDILHRLEELWSGRGQKPSIVIYGHRRMGKSSILHNLNARFGPRTTIVDFNMQRVGLVTSTGELLYNLALVLYDNLTPPARRRLRGGEPNEEQFTNRNPYTAFDRFLKRLDRVRARRRFIVTVDEFELIEEMITDGQLEPRLLDFWRGLIQTYPWFVMAFAGLHTLQEMTQDYWHPLYGSVTAIPVSFLSHAASWRLITQPTSDFPLDFDADAVEQIIALTHGQPYLVQLIGHGLVTRFNRQTFEDGVERERRFTLADVEAVIGAPEFYRDGDAYFTGVWRQAETSEPLRQTAVLRALAQSEKGIPADEIARQTGLAPEEVGRALETLRRHDVVMEVDGRWQFTVELMRRWVAQK